MTKATLRYSVARITAGASLPTASWWACRTSRTPTRGRWTSRSGASSRRRRCTTTRAASGRRGTNTARHSREYMGDFTMYLDLLMDGRDGSKGGSEILGGVQKWTMPNNWKFAAENFAGDGYHNISHRSVDMVGIGPSGLGRRDDAEYKAGRRINVSMPQRGHAAVVELFPSDTPQISTYREHRRRGRVFPLHGSGAPPPAGRQDQPAGCGGNGLPEYVLPGPPAPLHRRLAPARART